MLKHETKFRVRYNETDTMGFVHHSNYINYYEQARTEMLRAYGTTYKDMERDGVMMPVLEVKLRFYNPAFYDDLLTIETTMQGIKGATILFSATIHNQHGALINKGEVTLAFMNSETRRACRAPALFIEILERAGL